ncbi:carbohydrate ABC transporter permease [Kineothrix sp. MB12-C1]|uniref:carbohydrate ABC transporter permease n=1 Tax=Kineothrix sp. MB12-C1 TaxID=3070215 RepID=UPI0027D26941|nr:carbohydrate ABC transporter permease [Kineothrix sp. MB12-C1]WMC93619.1 carbohydrate ABC transporter permease [Kineothrix sp. MB12-C1]
MIKRVNQTIIYAVLLLLSIICLLPFIMMLVNATREGTDIMKSFTLIPDSYLADNWAIVQKNLNIPRGFVNSIFISVLSTLLAAYFSSLTAFGFAFYKFKGRKVIFTVIIVSMMIPAQLGLLGFYDLSMKLGLIDSYIPLIIPSIASPAIVFFLRQYILSVMPKSLLEAPRIDGASELYIFHRIGIPIMAPGIATMSIGIFIGSWNSYLLPLVILNSQKRFTLPVMIASLNSVKDIASNIGATYVAVAISVVPIIIVFCFCSKYIISSISSGSVKE